MDPDALATVTMALQGAASVIAVSKIVKRL
jgi:hypothetical protein